MRGTNPIRTPINDEGALLQVVEIFPTLQGEGPRAGDPAVFVRLGGCNLACDFCDTEFETFAPMQVEEIVATIQKLSPPFTGERGGESANNSPLNPPESGGNLIVITGGEPLRQNIVPLCEALIAAGFTVQIETNGTLWRPLPEEVEVVCSPKNTGQGYMPIRAEVLARADALKYVVSFTHPLYRQLPDFSAWSDDRPLIFVQPMDEYDDAKNLANKEHARMLAQAHGLELSLQLHKIFGIP